MFVTLNLDAQVACGVCKDTLSRNIYGDILRPGAPKLADWDELSMRVGVLRKAWLNYQAKYPQPKPEIAAAVAVLHWRRRRNQPALALPETESDEEDLREAMLSACLRAEAENPALGLPSASFSTPVRKRLRSSFAPPSPRTEARFFDTCYCKKPYCQVPLLSQKGRPNQSTQNLLF